MSFDIKTVETLPEKIGIVNIGLFGDWKKNIAKTKFENVALDTLMTHIQLHQDPIWKPLGAACLAAGQQWYNSLGHTGDLFISDSWLNKYHPGQSIEAHRHKSGIVSGVYYFEECSGIRFSKHGKFYHKVFATDGLKRESYDVQPHAGDLVLFMSDLTHESISATAERYSYAFNLFPTELRVKGLNKTIKINDE